MRAFWKSLRKHPGLPMGVAFPIGGFLACLQGGLGNALKGMLVMSIVWIPILATAWTGRKTRSIK